MVEYQIIVSTHGGGDDEVKTGIIWKLHMYEYKVLAEID